MFIYGWFYAVETLKPYIDWNNEIEEHYYLLKVKGINTIQDMKNYAYEVLDKSFIDKKFNENIIMFKETNNGILVMEDAAQIAYDTGYTNYRKIQNKDGSITYKVNIKDELYGSEFACDTTYEYKMTKNKEGKLVFKTFESPAVICQKDAG